MDFSTFLSGRIHFLEALPPRRCAAGWPAQVDSDDPQLLLEPVHPRSPQPTHRGGPAAGEAGGKASRGLKCFLHPCRRPCGAPAAGRRSRPAAGTDVGILRQKVSGFWEYRKIVENPPFKNAILFDRFLISILDQFLAFSNSFSSSGRALSPYFSTRVGFSGPKMCKTMHIDGIESSRVDFFFFFEF